MYQLVRRPEYMTGQDAYTETRVIDQIGNGDENVFEIERFLLRADEDAGSRTET